MRLRDCSKEIHKVKLEVKGHMRSVANGGKNDVDDNRCGTFKL